MASKRLQPLGHGVEVVASPDAADAGGRDAKALLGQLVGHPRVSPGRLLHRQLEDAPLDRLGHPVLRVRHPARHLDQRRLAALLVEVLEPIEAVAGKSHDPAGLADAAELLRQLQHADLVADDLLVPRHRVVSSLRYLNVYARRRQPNIPPKANRRWKNCFSPALYRGRNAIERMFCRLKDFRRIATRYDRLATNFLAAVCIAATVSYWL